MNTGVITLRKRWPVLAAVAVLVAIALSAGALFAASERQQRPELPATNPQSVADATGSAAAVVPPAVEPPVAPPAPERVPSQPADGNQEEADLPPIAKSPPKYPNLDSNLNRLVEQEQSQTQTAGQQPNVADSAGGGTAPSGKPVLVTFYVEPEQVSAVRQYLEDNDVFIRNVGEDYIEAHVPPPLLPAASELPGVGRVDTVIPPEPQSLGDVVSQGVGLHGADAWHNAGYRGQTVRVGVIDSGFEGFSRLQGSELPANVTARCYFDAPRQPTSRLADCEVDSDHGTAVAETLVDVAPDVELYIANPISYGDLRNAADWMASQGVKVINYSLGDIPDGPGDGTSPFSNSPLRTIDAAVSGGITWVTAAGNNARHIWYGTPSFRYLDPSESDLQIHHWTSDDLGNSFVALEGSRITTFMRWDDTWGAADCDLDLALWNYHPITQQPQLVGVDTRILSDPFAIIPHGEVLAGTEGQYFLTITKKSPMACPDDPAWIQLFARIDDDLQYHSPTHHMGNPEESRNPGQLAVGATHYYDTSAIASYSNRGPTIDGRTKPEITGIACGQSTVYDPPLLRDGNQCWFPGTSQAAPHVAGLAALVKQRAPNFSPAQVAKFIMQNALERGPAGPDNTWGHGLATLPNPSVEIKLPPPSPTANIDVRVGSSPDEAIISWDAVPGATHYRIGYVNMEVDYHLAKASCTEEWIEAFVYVDVNARNIPVANGRAEYTLRRLDTGARHAFTVLTSNNFVDTDGSVNSEFFWASPRWKFLPGRQGSPVTSRCHASN